MSLRQYIRINGWRFTPTYWGDWIRHWRGNLQFRLHCWWFWYSPPWCRTRRCPVCAGSGRYHCGPCGSCESTGRIAKSRKGTK